ncbi:MAG: thioredoxin family protein [Leptospiraceae bacterium]|nr:thioredoxin family protein [Leptospiraceae bacterium]
MKKAFKIFVAIILIGGCNKTPTRPISNIIENVDAVKFKDLVSSGNGIILDVRTPEEVAQGKIESASTVNLYDKDFASKIRLMQKDKPVYVYCRSGAPGGRSSQAAEILSKNGFSKIYNLSGGITGWMNNGFPVVKQTQAEDEKIQQISLAEFNKILKTDKPVLVDFHTKWCSPCIQMAPIVDKLAVKFEGKATIVRIDIDKSEEIKNEFHVEGVPMFVLFKQGTEKWKHSGIISEEGLKTEINKMLQ